MKSSITLVFATNNAHKFKEVCKILPDSFQLLNLKDIECYDDLPETGNTIKSNASQKAQYVHQKYGVNCFADDTGLEVIALNGQPGVYSARYAGIHADASENIQRLLREMKVINDRRATFRTCISFVLGDEEYFFEGHLEGSISIEPLGTGGFGYDSVFIPLGMDKTFAQLSEEEKNQISHRAIAVNKFVSFLSSDEFSKNLNLLF